MSSHLAPPPFPPRSKFVSLRTVTVDEDAAQQHERRWIRNTWNATYRAMSDDVRLLGDHLSCQLFFIDVSYANADTFAVALRSVGRLPVASLQIPRSPDGDRREIMATIGKLYDLKSRGWTHVELIFYADVSTQVVAMVVEEARRIGVAVALYGHPHLLQVANVQAATGEEIRATRTIKDYHHFLSKKKLPLYATEFGKPGSPGKAQIDLKSYALKHNACLTLMARETETELPRFYYSVIH